MGSQRARVMSRNGKSVCLSGPQAGTEYFLGVERPVSLGRSDANDITIADRSVSLYHARIFWTDDGYVIDDLYSRNGVFINGRHLGTGEAAWIEDGAEIQLGPTIFQFHEVVAPEIALSTTYSRGTRTAHQFKCPACGTHKRSAADLNRHMRKVHKIHNVNARIARTDGRH